MNNYWVLILLLQVVNVQCSEIVENSTIEIINEAEDESNDHFVGEIATDKNSMAYLAQHYNVDRAHNIIFNNITDRRCSKKVIERLINHYKLDISGLNYSTLTLLIYACYRSDAVILECLLSMGADPEVKDEWVKDGVKFGGAPLHWACEKNNTPAIKVLLKRKGINVDSTDARGATPLHWACRRGSLENIMALVQAGANLQAVDENGDTPLHYAYRSYINMIVSYLERAGADVTVTNRVGLTPEQVKRGTNKKRGKTKVAHRDPQEENCENTLRASSSKNSHKSDKCTIS